MAEKTASRGEIFVVDDDPAVRDTLSMVLSAGGYEVICFADGAALLSVARGRTTFGRSCSMSISPENPASIS